jgi:hypothetical protein
VTPGAWLTDDLEWTFGRRRTRPPRRRSRPRAWRTRPWAAVAAAVAVCAIYAGGAAHHASHHALPLRRAAHHVTPLRRIARCESGGDPHAVSPDGRYRGKYQFDSRTWRTVGGRGDPANASAAEQDRLAKRLLARRGREPWPVCGTRAG